MGYFHRSTTVVAGESFDFRRKDSVNGEKIVRLEVRGMSDPVPTTRANNARATHCRAVLRA